MEPKSKPIIDRLKEKIPLIKHVDYTQYGMTQVDIICADQSIRQYVFAFDRLKCIEPTECITTIYADVYIRIRDEILLGIALKEISLDDAINQKLFKIYGDSEIWDLQLKALKEILPKQNFSRNKRYDYTDEIQFVEENVQEEKEKENKDIVPPLKPPSSHLKFISDAFARIMQRKK